MKKFIIALCALATVSLQANQWHGWGYLGPHFHYTRVDFNSPSELKGYQAGVTAGLGVECLCYFANVHFEGTWNAGPITGDPCQKSDLEDYLLQLRLGRAFQCGCLSLIPYIGFGWERFENERDPSGASLTYRYDKLFVPLGLAITPLYCFCSWELGLNLEFRPDVWDQLNLVGVDLTPDWGYAFRVEAPFRSRTCCQCLSIAIIPFFDWTRWGKVSETNSVEAQLVIPRMVRWNLGLRLLIGYDF